MSRALTVALIGGDNRNRIFAVDGATLRSFPSSRFSGNGSMRRAQAAVGAGAIDLVVLLVRWLGHSEFDVINATCRAAGVPMLVVPGGLSAARREVTQFLAGC